MRIDVPRGYLRHQPQDPSSKLSFLNGSLPHKTGLTASIVSVSPAPQPTRHTMVGALQYLRTAILENELFALDLLPNVFPVIVL